MLKIFRLIITMNGARTYPDITKVVFEDSAAPSAMDGLPYADLCYNNCQLIEQVWYDENNQFVSHCPNYPDTGKRNHGWNGQDQYDSQRYIYDCGACSSPPIYLTLLTHFPAH